MKYLSSITIVIIIVATSCQSKSKDVSEKALMETALKICQDNIILDSHIDWPEKIYLDPADISKET
ncbi:MAG: hypothetical protein KAS29_19555 [Bacteroidales bacterium]|nr:hypothetical protein [Bacteroidales bacterium]